MNRKDDKDVDKLRKKPSLPTALRIPVIILGIAAITVAIAVLCYSCVILSVLVISEENLLQTHLPKIQQALDAQCVGTAIQVTRDGFDYDPILYWSVNQSQNGWRAECYWDQYDQTDAQGNWHCTCLKPFDETFE